MEFLVQLATVFMVVSVGLMTLAIAYWLWKWKDW